jgi:hypothetical protein
VDTILAGTGSPFKVSWPDAYDASQVAQANGPLLRQALISEPAVKALDVGALHRLAWLDEARFDANHQAGWPELDLAITWMTGMRSGPVGTRTAPNDRDRCKAVP